MSAHYDSYDYSSYWQDRQYEHESESIAIKSFLSKIKVISKVVEIGSGFGRLVPSYAYRAKSATITEPSSKLLALARKNLKNYKNVNYLQSTLANLPQKVKNKKFDLVLMVRVMHHLTDSNKVFKVIEELTSDNGYLILEFANKIHSKKTLQHILKGDFNFVRDETTIDVRSQKSKKNKTIPFLNYHPNLIKKELEKHNFKVIEIRSVSNIRSPFLKKYLPKDILLEIEKILQKPLSFIYFGPSIFILAKKRG